MKALKRVASIKKAKDWEIWGECIESNQVIRNRFAVCYCITKSMKATSMQCRSNHSAHSIFLWHKSLQVAYTVGHDNRIVVASLNIILKNHFLIFWQIFLLVSCFVQITKLGRQTSYSEPRPKRPITDPEILQRKGIPPNTSIIYTHSGKREKCACEKQLTFTILI